MSDVVLVTGATGQQGGAVARALLAHGHGVRALTRKPERLNAADARLGRLEIVRGSFDEPASLDAAMRGVGVVFAMGTPYEAGTGAEIAHGRALADAARRARVRHFVYSSAASAERRTGVPHFDSKEIVERHVVAIGLPYTILGPTFFMENLRAPWLLSGLHQGALTLALPRDRTLQMLALADYGAFAAYVVEHRNAFLGERVELASDERTPGEMVEILTAVTGRAIECEPKPLAAVREWNEDFALLFEWLDRVGFSVDVAGLRRDYPEIGWHSFERWAREQEWRALHHTAA